MSATTGTLYMVAPDGSIVDSCIVSLGSAPGARRVPHRFGLARNVSFRLVSKRNNWASRVLVSRGGVFYTRKP